MSKDYRHCRAGLPDLVVWNTSNNSYKVRLHHILALCVFSLNSDALCYLIISSLSRLYYRVQCDMWCLVVVVAGGGEGAQWPAVPEATDLAGWAAETGGWSGGVSRGGYWSQRSSSGMNRQTEELTDKTLLLINQSVVKMYELRVKGMSWQRVCFVTCGIITRETTAFNRQRWIMRWRSSLRTARIRNSLLTDSHSWCMTGNGSNNHTKLMVFPFFFWQHYFFRILGCQATKTHIYCSWLLMYVMTALWVYYASNYCSNVQFCHHSTRTNH